MRVPLWPPRSVGLGTPLNLALRSPETKAGLARSWWLAPVLGIGAAVLVVTLDHLLFGGETSRRTPDLGVHPPVLNRVLVSAIGALGEELFFRVGVASIVAWLLHLLLRRVMADPRALAQWAGVLAAVAWTGLWHVGMVGQPSEFWRVVTVNAVGNLAYGWLYWNRGFELAFVTHVIVTVSLYVGLPALR